MIAAGLRRESPDEGRRGCDVCGAATSRVIYKQRFVTFDDDAGLLDGYDVVTCVGCGFLFADGLPEQAVFERYYREMSKHEPDVDKKVAPSYKRHNTDLVARPVAERWPRRDVRILDVGVGGGETLLALRKLGYTDLTGLDPSARTAAVVRGRHGLAMWNAPLSMLTSCSDRFDVILLSGVLEHLRDLRPTLVLLKALLNENGSMCIAVPNATRFIDSAESPFQYLSTEHINFFTMKSLQSLFAQVGMALQACWESTALLGVFPEPIVQGVFTPGVVGQSVEPDLDGAETMARYVADSKLRRDELMAAILPLALTGKEVIVWGAGSLTMHLLSDRSFARLNIVAFVDANQNYWDKTIRGVPVVPPASVASFEQTILIVSYSYEDEIYAEIRDRHQLGNPVIRLFGATRGMKIQWEAV